MRYEAEAAETYWRARSLPPELLEGWRSALTAAVPGPVARVIDLGCGTGQFSGPLQEWFGATVLGIEPSAGMRGQAAAVGDVVLAGGVAEALPLRSGVADLVWLSAVIHQFADLDGAAAEIARVVAPGGRVAVRGYLADQGPIGWFGHFPGIERAIARFPTTDRVVEAFGRVGLVPTVVTTVAEWWPFSAATYAARVRELRHIDSMLIPLTDAEIEAGLDAVAAAHPDPDEVHALHGALRLVVLRAL